MPAEVTVLCLRLLSRKCVVSRLVPGDLLFQATALAFLEEEKPNAVAVICIPTSGYIAILSWHDFLRTFYAL